MNSFNEFVNMFEPFCKEKRFSENRNEMFFSQLVTISKTDCDDITQLTENCFDSDFDSENSGVFLL